MRVKKAMILAAGRGERLRPITDTLPKPLIQVGDRTLIEHHLVALRESGYQEVVINLAHLGNQIEEYLGNGSNYGLTIHYSPEKHGALETAGGIHHALPLLGDSPFLVVNGDIRCDIDFSRLILPENANMHLVMVPNPPQHPEGDFRMPTASSSGFLPDENKTIEQETTKRTFSGIGIYRPVIFAGLAAGAAPLAPLIRKQISAGKVSAELFEGYWTDVGTPQRLEAARKHAASPV